MLIQQPGFGDARTLTIELTRAIAKENLSPREYQVMAPPLAREPMVGSLLQAWPNLLAAGLEPGDLLITSPGVSEAPRATWTRHLVEAARSGDQAALADVADRCRAELNEEQRMPLAGDLLGMVYQVVEQAGGIDALLSELALHTAAAGGDDAVWVDAAAWIIAVMSTGLTVGSRERAWTRFSALVTEDKRLSEVIDLWLSVGAQVISPRELRAAKERGVGEQESGVVPGLPLARRAVRAVQEQDADAQQRVRALIAASRPQAEQAELAWDLACSIAFNRARQATAPSSLSTQADALTATPDPYRNRVGRMTAWAHQVVLGLVDGDTAAVNEVIDKISDYDDADSTYPDEAFVYATHQTLGLMVELLDVHERFGRVDNADLAAGAREVVEAHGPPQHRQAAVDVLARIPPGEEPVDVSRLGEPGPGLLLAAAGAAAWLATREQVFPIRNDVRLNLLKVIRESEGGAVGAPAAERVSSISDQEARAFLDQISQRMNAPFPMPHDPREWAPHEREIIGLLKEHLLTTPADATTREQAEDLFQQIIAVTDAALDRLERTRSPAPPPRARTTAKKKQQKRPKRPKPQRRKKK